MKSKIHYSLLMIAISSMLMLSCKKKSTDEPTSVGPCETKYEVMFGDQVLTNETATASYENGQIKSINSASTVLNFEYLTDRVNVSGAGVQAYRVDLSDKLAVKLTDLKTQLEQRMTYDGNRNLVKIEAYLNGNLTDTKILTYSNGNLATLTQTYTDDPAVKRVTTYSYSTEIATRVDTETRHFIFGSVDFSIPLFLTGSASRNILTASLYTYTSGNFRSDINKTYTYTRNGSGIPTRIVEDSHSVTVSNGVQTQDERLKQTILINSTCN
ncbi:hypothetical protein [Pedobacter sp. N23S346]|uniref:hypothetical protein n=1 Tax=Pedobacter sp. N23S346 TaxID=3402750 RepID=UPI003AD2DDD8